MNKSILNFVGMLSLVFVTGVSADPFKDLKASMAGAACSRCEFLSVIESDVFESVDTTIGTAVIASDGRYHIVLGRDEYLMTADRLYSYSGEENQLTVEKVSPASREQESVSFITRLDDHYRTRTRSAGREYFLTRTDSAATSLPDSLTVFLAEGQPQLERLVYFDVNGDRNQILFRKFENLDRCDEVALTPHFPDSAQVITLP